ncbi:MAG: PIN domain-containing protein [Desulfobulbaceae bacterium]|nr:PIN domain-containing protein [Desulfobulbaceae bacterium]
MILVDTSVWIDFFKQSETVLMEMHYLLREQKVITVEPVFSELLFGVRNNREKEVIESYWQVLPKIEFGENSMFEAALFASSNDYQNLGIGLMDAIIIKSTKEGNHMLWTLDSKINRNLDKKHIYPFK